MGGFLRDLIAVATGSQWGFSIAVWAGVSALLLLPAAILVAVARPVVDPLAVIVALRPRRVGAWMLISAVVLPLGGTLLFFTFVGIPLAVLALVAVALGGALGYIATALVVGDRLTRAFGVELQAWQAALVGVVLFRAVRLVPWQVGSTLHTIIVWFSVALACALAWDLLISFHRRRMPDAVQFAGEDLIEWDVVRPPDLKRPDGDQ